MVGERIRMYASGGENNMNGEKSSFRKTDGRLTTEDETAVLSRNYDVLIIGGGILGTMAAWKLSRYDLKVLLLEKEYDLGEGSAKANSGILYPGFQARGGSLKGISCVKGNAMYDDICRELDIPMKRTGCLYVTFGSSGDEEMMKKYKRGQQNGTPGMEIISGAEARRMEPLLSKRVKNALYAPNAAIISPFALVMSMAEAAAANGVTFLFDCGVDGISMPDSGPAEVSTSRGTVTCNYIINTAGENAIEMESFVRKQDLVIRPRRGQFYVFDKQDSPILSHVIYQAQETNEKGTLIAPTVEGNIIAGPTSENVRSYSNTDTTREGLAHVEWVAKKILPDLDMGKVITNFAGVRANITNIDKEHKDFVIRKSAHGMISALGIKNPGMTSAPYLTDMIIQMLREDGLKTVEKRGKGSKYKRQKPFLQCSPEEQKEMLARDPRYARVICRCEQITEGDIISALHSPVPPVSFNGFKKRLRIGMGRCQGGYCQSRLIEIVCRETGCRPQDFMKSVKGSSLVKGRLK